MCLMCRCCVYCVLFCFGCYVRLSAAAAARGAPRPVVRRGGSFLLGRCACEHTFHFFGGCISLYLICVLVFYVYMYVPRVLEQFARSDRCVWQYGVWGYAVWP